jgi:group I intron endonuclease
LSLAQNPSSLESKHFYSSNRKDNFKPVVVYSNAETQKELIFRDNKGKPGVYRWINNLNGKTYVGSSGNLARRFRDYLSISFLERNIKKNRSKIYLAILKYGNSAFSLEILEYCQLSNIIEREQFYINLLNPTYNILKVAGSTLGRKHSPDTIAKLKARIWTAEQIAKRTEHLKKLHASKEHQEQLKRLNSSKEQKERLKRRNSSKEHQEHLKRLHASLALSLKGRRRPEGAGRPSIPVEVFDTENNVTTVFPSISEAAQAIGVTKAYVNNALKRQKEKCALSEGEAAIIWIKKKRYKITTGGGALFKQLH